MMNFVFQKVGMQSFNHEVAEKLREISLLLEQQKANPFRSQAYFNAAMTLEKRSEDIRELAENRGIEGLIELPTIGVGIARSIFEYIAMGRMSKLEKLRGNSDPLELFQSIPNIGPKLAQRIHDDLQLDNFEALATAINQGKLNSIKGMGQKRQQAIEAWLFLQLGKRKRQQSSRRLSTDEPSVELLLSVDKEYRDKAKKGQLPLITPNHLNPERKAWLPIFHVTHGKWHFTALYSNTDRAHQLNRIYDWVVIYCYDKHHQEQQFTVVTETHGQLLSNRVVRGKEAECIDYYDKLDAN